MTRGGRSWKHRMSPDVIPNRALRLSWPLLGSETSSRHPATMSDLCEQLCSLNACGGESTLLNTITPSETLPLVWPHYDSNSFP